MCSHFSANQYENAFTSKKLRNWTVPRKYKEHPSTLEGFTQIIANDYGHLIPQVPRSKESPWGTFMGTWDMPCKIPPVRPSYTARSMSAAANLSKEKQKSPLNNAVNGYKESRHSKVKQKTSPLQRPSAPTPPKSNENMKMIPVSARAPTGQNSPIKTPIKEMEANSRRSSPRKSATPIQVQQSPKPATPPRSPSEQSLPMTPASGHGSRLSHKSAPAVVN